MDAAGSLPVIDMAPLFGSDGAARRDVAAQIDAACRLHGFFYVRGHGIPAETQQALQASSRAFFALPAEEKQRIDMASGGRAWRGHFPVGQELTSGKPDLKEGLYLGTELPDDDPRVQAQWPMHGANLWPAQPAGLRDAVLAYMVATERAAHTLMEGVALALGLDDAWFARHYTARPTVLFRIFHYPPQDAAAEGWGVGEHTDYGLLTLLLQDDVPGLQVRTPSGWIDAPPLAGTLVCNIGDKLDRLTGGLYRSTPHRVLNASGRRRYSWPLFFDPDFQATVTPLPAHARLGNEAIEADRAQRWDGSSVLAPFDGTYGDYLLGKVGKVFPQLFEATRSP